MSGILDLNLDEAKEPVVVPDSEYEVKITSMQLKKSEKGNEYFSVSLEIIDEPAAAPVFYLLMLPNGEDERMDNRWKLNLRRFFQAFDVDYNNLEVDTENRVIGVKGHIGWVFLRTEEDQEYGLRNIVKRVVKSRG
jgi:hypothetical protein